jgi:hypothetical protein
MTSPNKNHRKDGSFRAGNQARKLPAGEARVVLAGQRVSTVTLRTIAALAPAHGGIGKLFDAVFSEGNACFLRNIKTNEVPHA